MRKRLFLTAIVGLLALAPASATTVLEMNLAQLVDGSQLIFRGTVVGVEEITISAGGGTLPALSYTVRVEEPFKGQFATTKDVQIAEFSVLGTMKKLNLGQPILPGFPVLREGAEYLLMVGAPGPIGLSAPMGLAQGAFTFSSDGKVELVTNGANNAGLFRNMGAGYPANGPISYQELSSMIRDLVAAGGAQ